MEVTVPESQELERLNCLLVEGPRDNPTGLVIRCAVHPTLAAFEHGGDQLLAGTVWSIR
jgi:hypothetical protein